MYLIILVVCIVILSIVEINSFVWWTRPRRQRSSYQPLSAGTNNNPSDMTTSPSKTSQRYYPRYIRGIHFGGYQQPVYENTHRPMPKLSFWSSNNHAICQIYAVSVNPVDAKGVIGDKLNVNWVRFRKLMHTIMIKNTCVGFDFVGRIIDISTTNSNSNNSSSSLQKGTLVYGTMPPLQGSFSEYIKVPVHQIATAPSSTTTNVSMEEIAALPLVGLTAWQSLSPYVIPNQSNVLILGGSGGTGHVAIQIAAKALHAKSVTTVCSTRNIEFVKECGATYVIDYSKADDVIEALQRLVDDKGCYFDVILDCVTSGDPTDAQYQYPKRIRNANNPSIVTPNHLYQRLGGQWTDWIRAGLARPGIFPHSWLWQDPRERLFWIKFPHSSKALDEITKLVEEGKLKPHLQKIYPELTSDTVNQAFSDLLSRRVQGKIAITVTRDNEEEQEHNNKNAKN